MQGAFGKFMTFTGMSIGAKVVAISTGAVVAGNLIGAHLITPSIIRQAFIDVWERAWEKKGVL